MSIHSTLRKVLSTKTVNMIMKFLPKTKEDVLDIDIEKFGSMPTVGKKTVQEFEKWKEDNKFE